MIRTETAYAKLNLALHVRGQRADGYHDIETAFAFCEDGDVVTAAPASALSLTIDGLFAPGLPTKDNLVLDAARAIGVTASLHLTKNLPVASGIGGGSADAAAVLRMFGNDDLQVAEKLGADVPACVRSQSVRGSGKGEALTPLPSPALAGTTVLLVNPRAPLSTGAVFAGWNGVDRGPLGEWREGRNDLEAPARALVPEIAAVLDWLNAQPGTTFVRMSGSGATCFALFDAMTSRDAAAAQVPPAWWHMASVLR